MPILVCSLAEGGGEARGVCVEPAGSFAQASACAQATLVGGTCFDGRGRLLRECYYLS